MTAARVASVVVVLVVGSALAGCGGAPGGRLGAGQGPITTRPGTPAEVVNTTTTAPSVSGGPGTGSGSGPGSFPGSPGSGSGSGSGSLGGAFPGQPSTPSATGTADQSQQVAAMMDCMQRKGIAVPVPSTDSNGKTTYDQTALTRLSQDPKAQAAAQECSAQVGTSGG